MLSLSIRIPPILHITNIITSAWTINHKKSSNTDKTIQTIVILIYNLSKKFWTNINIINTYPIRLKKWFLWNIINSSTPINTAVKTNTIFNDQLSYLYEGTIANIWLVLAHPPSCPPPLWYVETLLEAAKFALDYDIARESGICGKLNGCDKILWSFTYDNKSACNYCLSDGFV